MRCLPYRKNILTASGVRRCHKKHTKKLTICGQLFCTIFFTIPVCRGGRMCITFLVNGTLPNGKVRIGTSEQPFAHGRFSTSSAISPLVRWYPSRASGGHEKNSGSKQSKNFAV